YRVLRKLLVDGQGELVRVPELGAVKPVADVEALSVAVRPLVEFDSKTVNVFVAGPVVIVTIVEVWDALVVLNPQLPVVGVRVTVTATPATDVKLLPKLSTGTAIVNTLDPFFGTVVGSAGLNVRATPLESTPNVVEPVCVAP